MSERKRAVLLVARSTLIVRGLHGRGRRQTIVRARHDKKWAIEPLEREAVVHHSVGAAKGELVARTENRKHGRNARAIERARQVFVEQLALDAARQSRADRHRQHARIPEQPSIAQMLADKAQWHDRIAVERTRESNRLGERAKSLEKS